MAALRSVEEADPIELAAIAEHAAQGVDLQGEAEAAAMAAAEEEAATAHFGRTLVQWSASDKGIAGAAGAVADDAAGPARRQRGLRVELADCKAAKRVLNARLAAEPTNCQLLAQKQELLMAMARIDSGLN